ncbi:MAG: YggS family pyridoxal phosphate-dependent enzyme [Chloroflexia bacterium]|nr:YggS family pyridoxal phosphate-dependent enzyme [Chloroflexia bacterium]
MTGDDSLAVAYAAIQRRVSEAATRAGRDPATVSVMAVTKTRGRATVDAALRLGITSLGENRVQEARDKFGGDPVPDGVVLSLIGSLQTNKAKQAVALFDLIESVDRVSLVEALARAAADRTSPLPVLIQVNVAAEAQKAGCAVEDAGRLALAVAATKVLLPVGVMTIAPLVEDADDVRPVFRTLRQLRDTVRESVPTLEALSMGMSNDLDVAIEEGATAVRVGRALFGDRG